MYTHTTDSPFMSYMVKISGPNRSAKIIDHFTCISVNTIYCITCTQIYIERKREKTGRPLTRTHTRCRKNDTDESKSVSWHFNLPNHSHHSMTICGPYVPHAREHRKSQKSDTKIHLSTAYTLSTRNK